MLIGTVIEPYKIVEKLGSGGMGEVYRAQHTTIGKYVAIKQLLPALAEDRSALERFVQEAVAAARINDPGIVGAIDQLTGADGTTFIVMELLEGETLAARIERERRLPLQTAALLARQIARAVAAAHRAGIIHRDLKPANIFLVADDDLQGGVRAKVLDFGLAKLVKFGTPLYMPPEQWRSSRDADGRADVYALGCIFYEMICGQPPFFGTREELQAQHGSAPVPPPSGFVPSLVPAADAVVMRALAKRPGDRFADMDEFAVALGTMAGSADHDAPGAQKTRAKWYAAAVAVASVAAVAAAAYFVWKRPSPLAAAAADAGRIVLEDKVARPTLAERCQKGEYEGCVKLGQEVLAGRALGGDREKAIALFRRACDGGNAGGCIGLGDLHAAEDLTTQASAFYQQGEELLRVDCGRHDREACKRLQRREAKR